MVLSLFHQAGVNTLLDVARQTYKEASIDAAELVSKLSGIKPQTVVPLRLILS